MAPNPEMSNLRDPVGRVLLTWSEPPKSVVAIINPKTRRTADVVESVLRGACPAGVDLIVRVSGSASEATELARACAGACDLIVAAGGDGTVADVAAGLIGSGTPLGIMPAGSTNIVAQELGIPPSLEASAALFFRPHGLMRRDVGLCGDRIFLHMAGAGFDAHFFSRSDRELKRKVGWLAYLPAAASALGEEPAQYRVTVDGEAIEAFAPLVVVANGGSVIRPELRIAPDVRADDGLFDVLVFTGSTPAAVVRTVAMFATQRLAESPDVIWRRGVEVLLESNPVMPIQLDGDVAATTPALFRMMSLAVELVVPLP